MRVSHLALCAALIATPAWAQLAPLPQDGDARFAALDLDGDGILSKAEAAGYADVMAQFDRADRNFDGQVTRSEWKRYEKRKLARRQRAAARKRLPGKRITAR